MLKKITCLFALKDLEKDTKINLISGDKIVNSDLFL